MYIKIEIVEDNTIPTIIRKITYIHIDPLVPNISEEEINVKQNNSAYVKCRDKTSEREMLHDKHGSYQNSSNEFYVHK